MKESRFSIIKNSKPLKKADIFLLIGVAILVALLFCVLFYPSKKNEGFYVEVDGLKILTFDYQNNGFQISSDWKDRIAVENEDGTYTFTVFQDQDKTRFNELAVDTQRKTVKVTESNCSTHKDCVYFPPLKDSGAIICVPHGLKVLPVNSKLSDPSIG